MTHETQLTPNFRFGEFASRGQLPTDPQVVARILKLAEQLQVLRDELGKPITIISGWRSKAHNDAVGGAKASRHMLGDAADIIVQGVSSTEVYRTIERLQSEGRMTAGGAHAYRGKHPFCHYDCRGWNARW